MPVVTLQNKMDSGHKVLEGQVDVRQHQIAGVDGTRAMGREERRGRRGETASRSGGGNGGFDAEVIDALVGVDAGATGAIGRHGAGRVDSTKRGIRATVAVFILQSWVVMRRNFQRRYSIFQLVWGG